MRRVLFLSTFLTLPGLAMAADFPLPAPVTQAEIYLQGATLTRRATAELPAGAHRLLVPLTLNAGPNRDISLEGATLGPVEVLKEAVVDGRTYMTAPQRAAHDAFIRARDAAAVAEDARLRAAADLKAAEDQLAFLRSIGGGSLTSLDSAAMLETLDVLGARIAQGELARADARAALRTAEDAVAEANLVLTQARTDLDATGANLGQVTLLAIGVTLDTPGPVALTLTDFTPDAGWQPLYDVRLDAEGTVTVDRKVSILQRTGLPLTDVDLTLSTANPNAQTAPRTVYPNPAALQDDKMILSRSVVQNAAPAPMALETMEDRAPEAIVARANLDGPVVTYDYPQAVTLPRDGDVTLALDSQVMEARVFNRAAPRTDQTAFLMAEVTNTGGEPLLPGAATIYREGARIGEVILPLVPAGDEVELAFGPQQHLRLDFVQLENATGDRGVFFTSGIRRQDMVFRVRNLSDRAEVVEARFALPYAEEEDLEVTVAARPAPDSETVEDRRGVAEWVLDVPAGGQRDVEIGVTLEWPQGETLIWQP